MFCGLYGVVVFLFGDCGQCVGCVVFVVGVCMSEYVVELYVVVGQCVVDVDQQVGFGWDV